MFNSERYHGQKLFGTINLISFFAFYAAFFIFLPLHINIKYLLYIGGFYFIIVWGLRERTGRSKAEEAAAENFIEATVFWKLGAKDTLLLRYAKTEEIKPLLMFQIEDNEEDAFKNDPIWLQELKLKVIDEEQLEMKDLVQMIKEEQAQKISQMEAERQQQIENDREEKERIFRDIVVTHQNNEKKLKEEIDKLEKLSEERRLAYQTEMNEEVLKSNAIIDAAEEEYKSRLIEFKNRLNIKDKIITDHVSMNSSETYYAYRIPLTQYCQLSFEPLLQFNRVCIITNRPFNTDLTTYPGGVYLDGWPVETQVKSGIFVIEAWILGNEPVMRLIFSDKDAFEHLDRIANNKSVNDIIKDIQTRVIYDQYITSESNQLTNQANESKITVLTNLNTKLGEELNTPHEMRNKMIEDEEIPEGKMFIGKSMFYALLGMTITFATGFMILLGGVI